MAECIECGSTTTPIWESDDEWASLCVCMECVKTKHWSIIKSLTLLNIVSSLALSTIGLVFAIMGLLGMELLIVLAFSPYPLYGKNRQRYKEWKRGQYAIVRGP